MSNPIKRFSKTPLRLSLPEEAYSFPEREVSEGIVMKKQARLISIAIALLMVVSLIPFGLFSARAEGEDPTVTVESRAGLYESVPVTETETPADGVTTTVQKAENAVTDSGMTVSYDSENKLHTETGLYEFKDHYTSQDANDTYEAEGGSDKSNEYHEPLSEVGIKIDEDDVGESSTVTGPATGVIETTGDVKESESDGVYDYTTTERITQSQIKVTTKKLEITDAHGAVNPDDMEYVHSDLEADFSLTIDNEKDLVTRTTSNQPISRLNNPPSDEDIAYITDGYQYVNLESDQVAAYWPGWLFSSPTTDGENPTYSDDDYQFYSGGMTFGNHLKRKTFYLPNRTAVNVATEQNPDGLGIRWDNVWFYTLADKHKNVITAYCADQKTSSEEFALYRIYNLEDAEYYEEEQAKHIRAIGNKGYWGLEGGESEFGTLDAVKKLMRDSGQFNDDEIESLTPGMAMCSMQMAIWSYSNVIKDDMTFLNVHHVLKNGSITPSSGNRAEAPDPDIADVIMRLYWLLYDLEPEEISEDEMTTETTIINEKNFLKSASLTITGKPADHAKNQDADKTNDVYTVDLEIALKVKPLEENGDDLVLDIQDQNGDSIVKARIAGPIQDGEVPATVISDGTYKIEGLELQEGETALKFALSGAQNLRNDVYFFNSEDENGTLMSQPMVGVAKGKRDVNIWMDLTFELDVNDEEVKKEHVWRTEKQVPHYTEIPITKEWVDDSNRDGVRPESITVHLLADGVEFKSATVKPDANGNWSYTFTELPKFTEDGTREVVYTITEDPVPEYTAVIDTYHITNTHTPVRTQIAVTKEWEDSENAGGVRPASITVHLFADGTEVNSATITPNSDGLWEYTFTNLLKFRDNGNEIVYTVTEDPVPEYETVISGLKITNKQTTKVEIEKEWQDVNDADALRPASITVHLFADGTEIQSATVTLDANGNWKYTFQNLPKYKDNAEIVYTVTEDPVPEYESEINGFKIINKHTPENTMVEIEKVWDDANDQDGKRPNSITVHLYADGTEIRSAAVTPDENGNWKYSFKELPKNKEGGGEIVYTVSEDPVPAYESQQDGFKFTNKHTPETIDLSGTKTWDDNNDADGLRPTSITIHLYADGVELTSVKVTKADGWKYSFKDMPKYKDGKAIVYTVKEDRVKGYTATYKGLDVTNTYAPPTGENDHPQIWIALLALSLLAGVALLMTERMYAKRRV